MRIDFEADAICAEIDNRFFPTKKASNCGQLKAYLKSNGRRGGIRTRYPLHPMQVLEFPPETSTDQKSQKNSI
jgi:hypothetical protein